jgi:hypothetical protein
MTIKSGTALSRVIGEDFSDIENIRFSRIKTPLEVLI